MGKKTIAPRSATSFAMEKGQYLKVICPEGEQVSDLVCFNLKNPKERLSNGKTIDYEETLHLSTGNTLYSQLSNPMLTITKDTVGVHDFLLAPCCRGTMSYFYGIEDKVPTCLTNLEQALEPYGIPITDIPVAFNIFMNVREDRNGKLEVLPPLAKSSDYIIFRAEMDLVIGLTACSALQSNNGSFKSIAYEITEYQSDEI